MKAEIIAVGTELLLGQIANTNGQYLSQKLAEYGIDVYNHICVGDNLARIKEALKIASDRSELILITGGLGPTDDDLTKEAVADFLGIPLVLDQKSVDEIKDFFDRIGRPMADRNVRQAYIFENSIALENDFGTAPGVYLNTGKTIYVLLPGPPKEMRPMFDNKALPLLKKYIGTHQDRAVIHSHSLRFYGIGESDLVDKINDLLAMQTNPTIAPLCSDYDVTIRITAKETDREQALALIGPVKQEIISRLGDHYYGDNDDTLVGVAHRLLLKNGLTVAVAESCTGGLLCSAFTDLPDSSQYFLEGIACYSNEAKIRLGVPEAIISEHGAVSEAVAEQLAMSIKSRADARIGIGITGIAGPGGGTADKPVGLVYVSVTFDHHTFVKRLMLQGQRGEIRRRVVNTALFLVIQAMKQKINT